MTSNASSPTFVIVPGHWHTLSHLTPLVDALNERGYRARPLQLHSVGAKSTRPTFSDDVCVIYSAVVQELIRRNDVCLVVHSYAGMPGAEAVNKIISDGALEPGDGRGRLIRTVFIAAYTFPAGFVMDVRAMLGPENPAFEIDVHPPIPIYPPLPLLTWPRTTTSSTSPPPGTTSSTTSPSAAPNPTWTPYHQPTTSAPPSPSPPSPHQAQHSPHPKPPPRAHEAAPTTPATPPQTANPS